MSWGKLLALIVSLFLFGALFGVFFWPGLYEYKLGSEREFGSYLLRINRITHTPGVYFPREQMWVDGASLGLLEARILYERELKKKELMEKAERAKP